MLVHHKTMKKKIAITVAVFDCLHEGHVNLLKQMREAADSVTVFVHDDFSTFENKGRFTVQKQDHRIYNLVKSGLIDFVFTVPEKDPTLALQWYLEKLVTKGEDIVYMRGDDWADFPGRAEIEKRGIEIRLVPYTKGVSTTQIRNELKA